MAGSRVGTGGVVGRIVGREPECAAVQRFLESDGRQALVITGRPGAGKTTVWQAGIDAAGGRSMKVLSTRPSAAEAQLSFAALADVLADVDTAGLDLPAPQRRALDVALLRTEPGDAPPDELAISVGFLGVLRALAARGQVLVAIDDVQWLDRSSAAVLAYAVRRLSGQQIRVFATRRSGNASSLDQALEILGVEWLEVGPLSLGAIRALLLERLALTLPRRVLRQVAQAAAGNPLFALELGRTLGDRPLPAIGEELPVPDRVEELIGIRVAGLDRRVRRLLLALALGGDLRAAQVETIGGTEALEHALEGGLVDLADERVRASHPLLAEAALSRATPADRRSLHVELAEAVSDPALRARHLALATDAPDEELAAALVSAAEHAGSRGANHEAIVLTEHALRLTPADSQERPQRVLTLAHFLAVAGEKQRVTDLLAVELESLPPGPARARGWLIMPGGVVRSNEQVRSYLEHALEESRDSPPLYAAVLGNLSMNASLIRVEEIDEAERRAEEGLELLAGADPDIERSLLYALACARAFRGRPTGEIVERFRAASRSAGYALASPERLQGLQHIWRGKLDEAEAVLMPLLARADERGEAVGYSAVRDHVCELALRRGRLEEAGRLLEDWGDPAERALLPWPMYERTRALHAAAKGSAAEADELASETIERAREVGVRFDELEALRARGSAALLAHDHARAVESLRSVWEHCEQEGVEEPGAFPVAPDLVEALADLGELEEAGRIADRLAALSPAHPWGEVTTRRCHGAVAAASGRYDEAAGELSAAADGYRALGFRPDQGRTLLLLGRASRRARKWRAGRTALEQAAAVFDEIGAAGWAEQARSDLDRVGARRPRAAGELTPSEARVAELAADGLSNKEIAQALVVSIHTVERHLQHAYAKLGIRSRTQLAQRLRAPD